MEPLQQRRQKIILEPREIPNARCSRIDWECLFGGAVEDWQPQIKIVCLERPRSNCFPTHFTRGLGCSQEKISLLDVGLEPGAIDPAFCALSGPRKNPN